MIKQWIGLGMIQKSEVSVGTVHTWGDGSKHKKESDGTWSIVSEKEELKESKDENKPDKITPEKAKEYYDNNEIPDGWYVHGRHDRGSGGVDDLETGYAIQSSKDWNTAEDYGRGGSMWMIKPKDTANVIDFNNPIQKKKFKNEFYDDYMNNNLPDVLQSDIKDQLIEIDDDGDEVKITDSDKIKEKLNDIAEEFDPLNIRTSAGAYDNSEWVNYLLDKKIDFVHTSDGSITLNNDAVDKVRVKE
jgi:hypothetical protein